MTAYRNGLITSTTPESAVNGWGVRTGTPDRSETGPYGGTDDTSPEQGKAKRGTTNRNERGSVTDRLRRREWLVSTYRADQDVFVIELFHGPLTVAVLRGAGEAACRCYRCGQLLTVDTVTVDRIKPGCLGGTYKRENIRPSCQPCASITGAMIGVERKRGGGKR